MSEARDPITLAMAAMAANDPPAPVVPVVAVVAAEPVVEPPPIIEPEPAPVEPVAVEPVEPAVPPAPAETKPRPTFQERINDLTAQRRDAQRRAEEAEARAQRAVEALERASRAVEPAAASPAPQTPPETPRPDPAKFENPDHYYEALAEWTGDRAAQRAMQAYRQQEEARATQAARVSRENADRAEAERLATTWQDRRARFAEEHPDFPDVAESDATKISMPMAQIMLRNEDGPAMAYWLGQNQAEAARIAAISLSDGSPDAARQIFEMGLIAARVAGVGEGRTSTNVAPIHRPDPPPPVTPVRSNAAATATRDPNTRTMEEEEAAYRAEMRAQAGGRR